MSIIGGLAPLLILVAVWIAFGWLHDYTMGYPPWFKKGKKK